jgi:putative transposase
MNQRKIPLVIGEYYHIFNRGVARAPTFIKKGDYVQAIASMFYYRNVKSPMKFSRLKELSLSERADVLNRTKGSDKLVEIVCYCLMPNHFHILLKQLSENGISIFISHFTNSYTKYVNTKNERAGPLFQGSFKSVHIETTDQLKLTRI